MHLVRVRHDQSQVGGQTADQFDIFPDQAPQHTFRIGYDGIYVDSFWHDRPFPAKCQQLAGETGSTLSRLTDLHSILSQWVLDDQFL
jgi:hypothetical protein